MKIKPLVYWKNTFLRRTVLVVTFPILFILEVLIAASVKAYQHAGYAREALGEVWRGRAY